MRNTYVLVGGGSGGHVVPLLPVASELKKRDPECHVIHIGHRDDPFNRLTRESESIDETIEISAGKLRRYYGESWLERVTDVKTIGLNTRDFFRFVRGYMQSRKLLKKLKPSMIFMKGGYVCASVGFAAGQLDMPYVTHDSDAMVSLAHKLIAKKARTHMTALPASYYSEYDSSKILQVGVPIRSAFDLEDQESEKAVEKSHGIDRSKNVVLVTGGGQGSREINRGVVRASSQLVAAGMQIIHVAGEGLYEETLRAYEKEPGVTVGNDVVLLSFTDEMPQLSALSDIVVSRASMTAMTEFAAQEKCCIVVPSPYLAGGHQLKNAKALQEAHAVVVVEENEKLATSLVASLLELSEDEARRAKLGANLKKAAKSGAAEIIAKMMTSH